MAKVFRICFALVISFLCAAGNPIGGVKEAYEAHYEGALHFAEGNYGKALRLFKRAHGRVPGNFHFALSLGLGLGCTGEPFEGLKVIQRGESALKPEDADYRHMLATQSIVEGMIYCFGGVFDKAIPSLKQGVELQAPFKEPRVLSATYNALGYATFMNQGRGSASHNGLPEHYHVHTRDLLRALPFFERALELNPENAAAQVNYQRLSDSLRQRARDFSHYAAPGEKRKNSYRNAPANIADKLAFEEYDELVFLLDISGSMVMEDVVCKGADRFSVMKEMLMALLNDLKPEQRLGLGTIDGDCGKDPKHWIPVGAIDRKALRTKFRFLAPDGTTPLLERLEASTGLFSDSTQAKKSIFLVSDGANICNVRGLDICEWAKQLTSRNITINILTFLDTNFENTDAFAEYSCLSHDTNGRILYIDNYRCGLKQYDFEMVEHCSFTLPEMQKVSCWGPSVKELWAFFPE